MQNILAFFLLLLGFHTEKPAVLHRAKPTIIHQSLKYDYNMMWLKVEEAQKKGLTKDALKLVEEIFTQAKLEKNGVQTVKALLHIMKFTTSIEENSDSLNINRIEKEIAEAAFPAKQILQSIQAEMYQQYYDNNRWSFRNRSATDKFDNTDFQTWDATRFVSEIYRLHLAAITPKLLLEKVSIEDYTLLLNTRNVYVKPSYRPTLYDLLAHRSLDFFQRGDYDITRPAYQFQLEEKQGLADAEEFGKIQFASPDSTSKDLHAAHIYQHLLAINKNNAAAFLDVDISRLHWAKEHAIGEEKDTLFLRALEHLSKKYANDEAVAQVYAELMQVYINRASHYNPKDSDKYRWDYKQAIAFSTEMQKRFPSANGTKRCKDLEATMKVKDVDFQIESQTAPNLPARASVSYRNHFQWYVRIIPYTESLGEQLNKEYEIEKRSALLAKQNPIKAWDVKFPEETDFHPHRTEIMLPAMPAGAYCVLMSDNANFSAINHSLTYQIWNVTTFLVMNIKHPYEKNIEYFVRNRTGGEPVSEVKIEIKGQYYDYNKNKYQEINTSGASDENGACLIKMPFEEGRYNNSFSYSLKATKGSDVYKEGNDYFYGYERSHNTQYYTEFFLDRAIFRPGQTIYFKGICLEKTDEKAKIIPNKKMNIRLMDANGQERAKLEVVSNEYGTYSGTFTAPTSGLFGQMYIQDSHGSSKYFQVEEYKRPKFEISIKQVEGSYKLGDKVTVKGLAMGFAGNVVDGADVKYRIVRQARYPYWGYYCWWRPMPSSPAVEITNGTSKTDEKGEFSIDFTAIPDATISAKDKPEFSYTVYVDVVDITGETHSTESSVQVGYIALRASVAMNGLIDNAKTDTIEVSTNNLNGVFEAAKGTIEIFALDMPKQWFRNRPFTAPDVYTISEVDFRKNFPFDVYKNEDDERNWKKGEKITAINFDTSKDKKYALTALNGTNTGRYLAEMTTKDKFGNEIKTANYFTLTDRKATKPTLPTAMNVSFDKTSAEPGTNVIATISSSDAKCHVIWTLEQNGKVLDRQYLTLTGKNKEISIPIKEEYRGNISVSVASVSQNQLYKYSHVISVPWSNKDLKLEWSTFRNKLLPGAKEEWRLKISGPKSEKVAAEMVAAMYDASLDEFASNYFSINSLNPSYYGTIDFHCAAFGTTQAMILEKDWNKYENSYSPIGYDRLNLFGFYFGNGSRGYFARGRNMDKMMMAAPAPTMAMSPNGDGKNDGFGAPEMMFDKVSKEEEKSLKGEAEESKPTPKRDENAGGKSQADAKQTPKKEVQIRKNLQETAFFFPTLLTNEAGEIILSFTMPEALTKWKFLGFAHTKDLKTGYLNGTTVTQKDLMIQPNAPRFMRIGDKFAFSAKISNLSAAAVSGTAKIELIDAISGKDITSELIKEKKLLPFTAQKGQSALAEWQIEVPKGLQAVIYRVIAEAGEFSDGEENALPVVLNQMLVTETAALWVRSNSSKTFKIPNLLSSGDSKTLQHQQFTLEITSNPAWYAIQALPYLMEYPHECTEQLFSRYYANSMASHIATTTPRVQQVFEQWRNAKGGNKEALLSNLSKNQELKSALLEETPWVLEANDESERKKRVGLLFDLNKMATEKESAETKLLARQNSNGGFAWFPGMKESAYITEVVALGLGHSRKLGVSLSLEMQKMSEKAVHFLDGEMKKQLDEMKRYKTNLEEYHLSYSDVQYLYMRSFYTNVAISGKEKAAYDYFWKQGKKYALDEKSLYMKGMMALALHRSSETKLAKQLIEALRQNAVTTNEEMGMYWKNEGGYWWYQAPIETQALLIEAFFEVDNDLKSVEDMKVWLLKNKQTNDWKTTRATTEACNALFLTGDNMLEDTEIPEIKLGSKKVDLAARQVEIEAGTGHFKTAWQGSEITPEMGTITLTKKQKGMAWGGAYWQYFENLDKIKFAATPLAIKKQLFIEKNTPTGPKIEPITTKTIKQGDKIVVRVEIRVDRDMEYVHLKDMRAAGFEPINTVSSYKYQDGLGYYESTRDMATHFFIDYLPKGTYVFEYALRATHKGNFSNGITTMQSMYAPEFTSHSEGIRVVIE